MNKAQKTLVFDTLTETVYHQSLFGGRINKVSGWYDDEILREIDEDKNQLEYDEVRQYRIINGKYYDIEKVEKETEKQYYMLTVTAKAELTNGYRYIKELLLQIHNFRMYEDYCKLTQAGVKVHYVKTDAFLIDTSDLWRARRRLDFSNEIGGWRVEKDKQYRPPTDNYEMKPSELLKSRHLRTNG